MTKFVRHDGRGPGDLREVTITPGFVGSADGSCLMEMGRTRVICTACVAAGVRSWRQGQNAGWITAEYGMLPASTGQRKPRPTLKPDSRGTEIQRLIGRVLRNAVDLRKLGENTVEIDCDVLEADGGTRTAAITGGYVALALALQAAAREGRLPRAVRPRPVAAVSVGLLDGRAVLDLDYPEDSQADVDLNVAMAGTRYLEIQGTSERSPFTGKQLDTMLRLARRGIRALAGRQKDALKENAP